jgi:alkylation response protein AidB-like acyl-CoA dehydrogenase
MAFFQPPPALGNPFSSDRVLRSYLARVLPDDARRAILPTLDEMGEIAASRLEPLHAADPKAEPRLVQWDAWGNRVDRIDLTPLWIEAAKVAAEKGVVATAYERAHGEHSRVHQFALVYLFEPPTAVYSCPLAMTDGAAKTLATMNNKELVDRALPRLLSRDPKSAWTSGQWMTERTGGSDVAISETIARQVDGAWRLYGTKWFTSATTSQMALTLARPEGNPPGGSGLALFYVEMRDERGAMNGIAINRLKDKLGTRMVPTAELTLDGARAIPVVGLKDGIKNITPMLTITRTWNAVCATAGMSRAIALVRDYAKKRVVFGAPLADKPLHLDTVAGMEAEYEAAFLLAFRAVELLGREEAGVLTEVEAQLARLLTPIAKLVTGKQAVAVASEALEAFGGAGYVEDTMLPRILRDAQVLPIWEGTTNVLSLDVLRALARVGSLEPIEREVARCCGRAEGTDAASLAKRATDALAHANAWLARAQAEGLPAIEAGARRLAMTLGRALELGLLIEHAAWSLRHEKDTRALAAARRFARHGIDCIVDDDDRDAARALANDVPMP